MSSYIVFSLVIHGPKLLPNLQISKAETMTTIGIGWLFITLAISKDRK